MEQRIEYLIVVVGNNRDNNVQGKRQTISSRQTDLCGYHREQATIKGWHTLHVCAEMDHTGSCTTVLTSAVESASSIRGRVVQMVRFACADLFKSSRNTRYSMSTTLCCFRETSGDSPENPAHTKGRDSCTESDPGQESGL